MNAYDVIVIGGGPAGATAALYTSRAELKTLVLDMSVTSGALGITSKIANYPGILEVISGKELVERMWKQAQLYGAEFRKEKVIGTDFSGDEKKVFTSQQDYAARAVILATGAMGRSSVLEGEQEFLGKGVSYCATCDGAFFKDKEVLVYGNNEYAYEEAGFLSRFAKKIHFVAPKTIEKASLPEQAEPYEQARLVKITGNGKVSSAEVSTKSGTLRIPVDGVFIYTSGNKPVVHYLNGSVATNDKSCLLTDASMRTNAAGIFACGDVLCNEVQQAVVAAAQGCIAALSADKYLRNRKNFTKDYN
jgi:thioredoxin reductase (NADPH)